MKFAVLRQKIRVICGCSAEIWSRFQWDDIVFRTMGSLCGMLSASLRQGMPPFRGFPTKSTKPEQEMPIRKIESYEIRGFQRENRPPFGEFGKKPAGFDGKRKEISENLRSRDKKFEKFTDIRQKSGGAFHGIIKILVATERIEGPGPARGMGGEPFRQVGPKGPE